MASALAETGFCVFSGPDAASVFGSCACAVSVGLAMLISSNKPTNVLIVIDLMMNLKKQVCDPALNVNVSWLRFAKSYWRPNGRKN
jgi:hypothetical protein